jgi:hypothetical protein
MSHDRCWCKELPASLPGLLLTDEVRIASVAEELEVGDSIALYRCLVCGQLWEDRFAGRVGLFKV